MEIVDLFEKVLKDADYTGEFGFGDLIQVVSEKRSHALAVQAIGKGTCIIVFVNGEGEGAIQVDEHGMMFGDKVVYNIDKNGSLKLFLIDKKIAESISARCRIYEKSHLMDNKSTMDLPELSKFSLQPAKITINITHDGTPAEGLKVKLFRVGEPGVFDTTSKEGRVSFVLFKGQYDCIITGADEIEQRYKITNPGKDSVIDLKL